MVGSAESMVDETLGTEMVSAFPKVTQLVVEEPGLNLRSLDSQSSALSSIVQCHLPL